MKKTYILGGKEYTVTVRDFDENNTLYKTNRVKSSDTPIALRMSYLRYSVAAEDTKKQMKNYEYMLEAWEREDAGL